MEEYVYIDGKKYRRGYTTGSCAAAAAKASVHMLFTNKKIENINIDTPKGIPLTLKVKNIELKDKSAVCSIEKDGGDDIDATHTMDIFAKAELIPREDEEIIVTSGVGIGIVTKKGLSVEVGKPAINPVPMRMIRSEISKVLGENHKLLNKDKSLKITIFAPQGEEIAKKTFNPRLGIVGGISILGTTGIVEPMSEDGWKKSLSIELEMKKAQGMDKIILVPGNHGEEFIREHLKIDMNNCVRMSNFVGYMLNEAKRLGFKKILMAGHIGKFIKISAGIFNTHSKVCDARNEIMIANLALMGADLDFLKDINECVTAEGAVEIIDKSKYTEIYNVLCNKCKERVEEYLNEDIQVEVYMFRMDKSLLGKSTNADLLTEDFR
ncbi:MULTISPECIES: cobalt-precorrin-5B (C(1))-methyltransferase CbiD [Terrisporobacter]|uniref:Cobalt-precorrin-5B C(1)-methyltransferase n=1 Tax=Terrisporobacter othiniensis TaxID=1577792 RepID=A0A0B3W904_9FIRM|nr:MULTISPECIES: cobalt-precorrin-5B (C(1))-methyltransferase CbiD [Terrisporobacter]KHS58887.1 cobalt-precorrin-6A synthase [Terrisporobacter othiniensis]MCC3671012.1 cobalt-precorrin-5B (C(1))-methyltransferase CbiD [Terrisporobacter mayombei]MDU6984108.1 cobalt-precorrin-5B (C(1))-methyltransferase CbiD [Terrisporobacter othiniensis]